MNEPSSSTRIIDTWLTIRFLRWLFSWPNLRRALIGVACAATLIALFYAEENWRGKRAWEKFRREWEAKGEHFDLASFVPKPVPPDQNFAMTPLFAPLFEYEYSGQPRSIKWKDTNALSRVQSLSNFEGPVARRNTPALGNMEKGELTDLREWQRCFRGSTNLSFPPQPQEPAQDVLFALSKSAPVLNELHEAAHRPYAVFPVHYEENFQALLPHLASLKGICMTLRLRSAAYLQAGRTSEALDDIKLAFRLADSIRPEPLLISYQVRKAILQITLNSAWEGLTLHRWDESQLAELQKLVSSVDLLGDYHHALRGERAFNNDLLDKMRHGYFQSLEFLSDDSDSQPLLRLARWAPSGFFYQNQLCLNRLHQETTLPVIEPAAHRVYPERYRETNDHPELRKPTPYNILARLPFPAVTETVLKTAYVQSLFDLGSVACALERFRLANGHYPESLAALIPRFMERIPHDLINGAALKYHAEDKDRFFLYSVGWNSTDDGGVVAMTTGKTPWPDCKQGDWVWRFP